MSFEWKYPNKVPDKNTIQQMQIHFPKPAQLMPIPWFISTTGPKITFHTAIAEGSPETIGIGLVINALSDIAGGLRNFPGVSYVDTWVSWFKYLLPYAIQRSDEYGLDNVLPFIIAAFMNIYRESIREEYSGFRQDIVYSLGTRIIPPDSSDKDFQLRDRHDRLFGEIWDYSRGYKVEVLNEVGLPIVFCLKYLTSPEITTWVESLVKIDSPQWFLQFILWWLAFNKFLQLAKEWPENGNLGDLFEEAPVIGSIFQVPRFESLNAFIPLENINYFQNELRKQLTSDVFQSWTNAIRRDSDSHPIISEQVEKALTDFRERFFSVK